MKLARSLPILLVAVGVLVLIAGRWVADMLAGRVCPDPVCASSEAVRDLFLIVALIVAIGIPTALYRYSRRGTDREPPDLSRF